MSFNVPDDLRNKCLEEDKAICLAVALARNGDNSGGEMIQTIVAKRHAEGKNDPDQFNAVYAYAKTRHMLDRYNYLLSLSEDDRNAEVSRSIKVRNINPKALMSQYFSFSEMTDRFIWTGRICSAEAQIMYDIMQVLAIHPIATMDEYIEKLSSPVAAKILARVGGIE